MESAQDPAETQRLLARSTHYEAIEEQTNEPIVPIIDHRENMITSTTQSVHAPARERDRTHFELIMAQLLPDENNVWSIMLVIFLIFFLLLFIIRILSHPYFLHGVK
jgi:hypothetical protein